MARVESLEKGGKQKLAQALQTEPNDYNSTETPHQPFLLRFFFSKIIHESAHILKSVLWRSACRLDGQSDNEGIRTLAGRAQWISSPSP